jgi:hypothetical protein
MVLSPFPQECDNAQGAVAKTTKLKSLSPMALDSASRIYHLNTAVQVEAVDTTIKDALIGRRLARWQAFQTVALTPKP